MTARRLLLLAAAASGWLAVACMWVFWEPEDTFQRGREQGREECEDSAEAQRGGA